MLRTTRGLMTALCLCLMLAAGACTPPAADGESSDLVTDTDIPARIQEFDPADLNDILASLWSNSRRWTTVTAEVNIRVRSPRIQNPGSGDPNVIDYRGGELYLFKGQPISGMESMPSIVKINLSVGQSISLVSDGAEYYVNIPRLEQEYFGRVGEAPSSGRPLRELPVVPVRPQDIGEALASWGVFWNCFQVIKQDIRYVGASGRLVEVLSLEARQDPTAQDRLRLANNLVIDRNTKRPVRLYKYGEQDAPRAIVVYGSYHEMNLEAGPVAVPEQIWIGYPETASSMLITLKNIKANVSVRPSRFRLVETSP